MRQEQYERQVGNSIKDLSEEKLRKMAGETKDNVGESAK